MAGVEPAPPRCKRGALATRASSPRCGRMESNHHSAWHQIYRLGSSPVLSVRMEGVADRIRTDAAGITTPGAAVTPQPPRTGTTGLEPATSRLTSECSAQLSYAPEVARLGFEPRISSS
jgi:hypothetical protein